MSIFWLFLFEVMPYAMYSTWTESFIIDRTGWLFLFLFGYVCWLHYFFSEYLLCFYMCCYAFLKYITKVWSCTWHWMAQQEVYTISSGGQNERQVSKVSWYIIFSPGNISNNTKTAQGNIADFFFLQLPFVTQRLFLDWWLGNISIPQRSRPFLCLYKKVNIWTTPLKSCIFSLFYSFLKTPI